MKDKIISFLKDSIENYGYKGAVIGVSGGIDSAVTGKLLVEAIGKEKVFGLLLPERDSAPSTIRDSRLVCSYLGIDNKLINLTPILRKKGIYRLQPPAFLFSRRMQERYTLKIWEQQGKNTYIDDLASRGDPKFLKSLAYYRLKHRTRMTMLYFEGEKRKYAVTGSTNKTETKTGFYVKYGDDSVDFEPLAHLYKTEVYALAEELGIPGEIIRKKASPDVAPGITDEFALGLSYADLDRILDEIEKNGDLSAEDPVQVKRVEAILEEVKHRELKSLSLEL